MPRAWVEPETTVAWGDTVPYSTGAYLVMGQRPHWPVCPLLHPVPKAEAYRIAYGLRKRGTWRGWVTKYHDPDREVYLTVRLHTIEWGRVVEDRIAWCDGAGPVLLSTLLGLPTTLGTEGPRPEREKAGIAVTRRRLARGGLVA